jgi:hypothetical protein
MCETSRQPWDVHPALQAERFAIIGRLFDETRSTALQNQQVEVGDDNWVLGCKFFVRCRAAIKKLAESGLHPWLKIVTSGQFEHFVFSIDGVPIRFYKGDAEHPTDRALKRSYTEVRAQQMAFSGPGFAQAQSELFWRMAVEIGHSNLVEAVTVLQTNDAGEVMLYWPVPRDGELSAPVTSIFPDGVELDAPEVGLPEPLTKTAQDNGND